MTNNLRDTQFAGFADALLNELLNNTDGVWLDYDDEEWQVSWKRIIAHRAYDLVFHAFENTGMSGMEYCTDRELMQYVPDMPELPETQE